jgi:hypothetical protein
MVVSAHVCTCVCVCAHSRARDRIPLCGVYSRYTTTIEVLMRLSLRVRCRCPPQFDCVSSQQTRGSGNKHVRRTKPSCCHDCRSSTRVPSPTLDARSRRTFAIAEAFTRSHFQLSVFVSPQSPKRTLISATVTKRSLPIGI